jgi:hypothetical protein
MAVASGILLAEAKVSYIKMMTQQHEVEVSFQKMARGTVTLQSKVIRFYKQGNEP